jgi:NAD(P)-dependent dehydrogenase (short-subunit alcohol dehydrogenase family)
MTQLELLKSLYKTKHTLLHISQLLDVADLNRRGETEMAVSPVVAAIIAQFDDATNAVAGRIQTLVNAAGLTPEEIAAFQVEIDRLKTLGADPNNPVPPAPPIPA